MNRPAPYRIWVVSARAFAEDEEHFKRLILLYRKALREAKAEERRITSFDRRTQSIDRKIDELTANFVVKLEKLRTARREHLKRCEHPEQLRSPPPWMNLSSTSESEIVHYCRLCGENV